ncbi:hypothetical protein STRCI_001311 [Streptomyces cinnabarinus]|uniref:Uncharacterized protein n=1 Tax=Streptomyces cinnabarinus TaxID=67287 RepID=A0ABY7K994_9ACTN|nr:hypothetical protein [Streptomyces cinnabarinus]WAZ20210.1 hypothetical protein STRCI_001311 [Streptomyces cinnabarinus]
MIDEPTVTLTFKRYALQFLADEEVFLDLDVSMQREIFGQYLFQLRTKLLADDLPPHMLTQRTRVPFEVPASTWQMWKKRHACRWYARRMVARWPVRYEPDPDGRYADAVCSFDLERFRTYPQARVQLPRDQFGMAVLAHGIRNVRWSVLGREDGHADA